MPPTCFGVGEAVACRDQPLSMYAFLMQSNPMNPIRMYFHRLYNISLFLALIHEPFYPFTDRIGPLRLIQNGLTTRGRSSCWDCVPEGSGATASEIGSTSTYQSVDESRSSGNEPSEMSSAEKKRMKKRVLRRKKGSRKRCTVSWGVKLLYIGA